MIGLPRGHIFLLISFVPKTSVFCVAYFVLLMCDPLLLDSSCGLAGVSASNLVVGFTSPAPIHFLTGSYSSNAGLLVISVSSTTLSPSSSTTAVVAYWLEWIPCSSSGSHCSLSMYQCSPPWTPYRCCPPQTWPVVDEVPVRVDGKWSRLSAFIGVRQIQLQVHVDIISRSRSP